MRIAIAVILIALILPPVRAGESFVSTESVIPVTATMDGIAGFGQTSPLSGFFTPSTRMVELAPPIGVPGLIRRSLTQERVIGTGPILNFGIRSRESTEISLSPLGRTTLSLTTNTETLERLDRSLLNGRTVRVMGLTQGFGSDATGGTLGFTSTTTSTTDQLGVVRDETTRVLNLNAKLPRGVSNVSSLTTRDSSDRAGIVGREWATRFNTTLPGGEVILGLTHSDYTQAGQRTTGRTTDLVLPLRIRGHRLDLARHTSGTTVNGILTARDDSDSVNLPFTLSGRDALFSLRRGEKIAPGLSQTTRGMDIVIPLQLAGFGVDIQRHIYDETKNGVVAESDVSTIVLPLRISGNAGRIAYVSSDTLKDGVRRDASQFDVELPLVIRGGRYMLERHDVDADVNGVQADSVVTRIAGPIPLIPGATGEHTTVDQTVASIGTRTSTLHLAAPVRVVGQVDLVDTTQETPTSTQSQCTVKVTTPMLGEAMNLQHQTTRIDAKESGTTQSVTQVVSPRVNLLGGVMSVNARLMRTDTQDDSPVQRVTGIDLSVRPTAALLLQGSVEDRDTGPTTEGSTQTLTGTYDLHGGASLNARMTQNEVANQRPTSDRRLILVATPGGIRVSAGLVAWVQGGGPQDHSQQLSVAMGDPKGANLSAEYRGVEFDKDGRTVGLASPVRQVSLGIGDPARVALQLRHLDSPGQPNVERGLNLRFGIRDGSLSLGYGENTADPRNPKLVRVARMYDVGLDRNLGRLRMSVGLRHCGPTGMPTSDLFRRIEISGGDAGGTGEIKLTSLTGDFVTAPADGQAMPDSTLDLSFTRGTGEDRKLTLTFRRSVSPLGDDTQGLLMCRMSF